MAGESSGRARKRWGILSAVVKQKELSDGPVEESKRQFQTFGLIQTQQTEEDDSFTWHEVKLSTGTNVKLRLRKPKISLHQLIGFNNTGNVCVWPSEECLAIYCMENPGLFAGKRVLELGGGQTCLAGVCVAATAQSASVLLTDGNQESVDNLGAIVELNPALRLRSELYRWDAGEEDTEQLDISCDAILCADCFFFEEGRAELAAAMHRLLRTGGRAYLAAPERAGTLTSFLRLASPLFGCDIAVDEVYSQRIWSQHETLLKSNLSYLPDIHYPKLVILTKS